MWGRNCSEIATSGRIFVLTLNRALALKVSDNEIYFLLPQIIVAITKRIGLESKLPPACFDLQFCHCQLCNHKPIIANTNNQTITGLQTSKL